MKQPKKLAVLISATVMAMAVAVAVFQPESRIAAQNADTLTAMRVSTDVSNPFDTAWEKIPQLAATLDPQTKDADLNTFYGVHYPAIPSVTLQAAYDDKTLWIRAVWPDDTMNARFADWTFDGTKWSQNTLRQDRISYAFPITKNAQFTALGCGAICHTADSSASDYMGYPVGSKDIVDIWQWKAAQTGPVGYADHQWIGAYVDDKGAKGPTNNASTGAVPTANKNKAGDAPAFMYKPGIAPIGPLTPDNSVAFDPTAKFVAGYILPGYVVARPGGSRGDVNSSSVYTYDPAGHGFWYVVLSRPLNTGKPEDAVFTLGSSSPFGVAVFNNGDDKAHATKNKLTLTLGQ